MNLAQGEADATDAAAARAADALQSAFASGAAEEELRDFPILAATLCDAPMAAFSLVGTQRLHLVARVGIDAAHAPREAAFCVQTLAAEDVFEVPDAAADRRFADSPLVTGAPGIGAYAGVAIADGAGRKVGSLFVAWHGPRRLPPAARDGLRRLARQLERSLQRQTALAEARRMQDAIREGDRRFRRALEALDHVAVQAYRLDGRITFWNRASESLYGWRADEALGADIVPLLLPPELHAAERALLAELAASGANPAAGEVAVKRRDGSMATIYATRVVVPSADGEPEFFCFDVDVTARRAAEDALRASEERLRAIADSIPGAIFRYVIRKDGQHAFEFISQGATAIWEHEPAAIVADAQLLFGAFAPEEDRDAFRAALLESARTLGVWQYRWRILTPSGRRKWLQASGQPVRRENGDVAWDGYVFDVTERREAEAALALSEARLRVLMESAPDAILVLDLEAGRFVDFNGRACRLFGVTEARLRELGPAALSPESQPDGRPSAEAAMAYLQRAAAGEAPVFEWTHQRADGSTVPCEVHLVRIPDPSRTLIRGSIIDISTRKAAEAALRESERRFRTLVEDVGTIAVQGYDDERRITFWNRASEQLYGWTAAEALGRRLEETIIPPPMREAVVECHARWMREGRVDVPSEELVLVDRNGMPVPVYSSHIMLRRPDGGHDLYCLDVDLRDLRRTEAALQEANAALRQRNEELQQFVMIASHDLQEPLRKVQTFADRLQGALAGRMTASERDHLERLHGAASRMRELIQDLLDYSAVSFGAPQRAPVDLSAVLREVLDDLAAPIAASGARIDARGLPTIDADPVQMRQLLQNLVSNALKYRHPQRAPQVRVEAAAVDAPGGPRIALRVVDNGIGFDDAHRERIFAPFQRLHARTEYEGTGIGLAIVRRIAERHGGTVEARGRPGEGATFTVVLPVARAARSRP